MGRNILIAFTVMLSIFLGFPYFIDPIVAASFHEVHWLQGILQAVGFFITGWLCHEAYTTKGDATP